MKSKFIITFIFFALAAFGAKAETAVRDTVPVTKRGITPPRNLQNYDPSQAAGKFGQVMGVKRYSGTAGDTMVGYLPFYVLSASEAYLGTDRLVTAGNISSYAPATDLGYTASTRVLTSSTGTDVTLPLSSASAPGLLPTLGTSLQLARVNSAGTSLEYFTPSYLSTVTGTARFSGSGTSGSPLELAQQGAATGQGLGWNGAYWAPWTFFHTASSRFSGAGTAASPLELAQQSATSGQVLTWNGTSWAPAAPSGGVTGSGTTNYLPKWSSGTALGNSVLLNDANGVAIVTGAGSTANIVLFGESTKAIAGRNNTGFGRNVFSATMGANTDSNVAIGDGVLAAANGNTVDYNTGVGASALGALTTGYGNTALGYGAAGALTTGYGNTALGYGAAGALTTGAANVALGSAMTSGAVTGASNLAIGSASLNALTSGASNIAIGASALRGLTTGSYNVRIGADPSDSGYNGNTSVFIGYAAGFYETSSDRLYIDNSSATAPLIGGNFSSNYVGINRTVSTLANTLEVGGDALLTGVLKLADGSAAAPAETFANDLNTGLFRPTDDVIGFSTGGAERMRIDASGRIGIGVTPSYALHVVNSGTTGFSFSGSQSVNMGSFTNTHASGYGLWVQANGYGIYGSQGANGGTTYFSDLSSVTAGTGTALQVRPKSTQTAGSTLIAVNDLANSVGGFFAVKGDGKVGIGTASPAQALHVVGNLQWTGAAMPGGSSGTAGQVLTSAGAGAPPTWGSAGTIGGTAAANRVAYGDGSNSLTSSANFTYTSGVLEAARSAGASIRVAYSAGSVYTDIGTNSSGYGFLSPTGKRLGVNTTAPLSTLHLQNDGTNTQGGLFIDHNSGTMSTGNELQLDLALGGTAMARVAAVKESTGYGLKLYTGGAGAVNGAAAIAITGADDITIGTTASTASINFQGPLGTDDYQTETANSGTLAAKSWHYIDPTGAAAWTLPGSMNDGTWLFVVNQDGTFDITISAPGGETLTGSATITAGKTGMFHKSGTVWYRITF